MLQILWQAVRENLAENLAGCARENLAENLAGRLCDRVRAAKHMAVHNAAAEKAVFALLCADRANFPWSITECQSSVKVFRVQ